MGIRTNKTLLPELIFFTIVLMLAGLFVSRALLSVGMILFLVLTCLHWDFYQQLRSFFSNRFLIGLSLLFLIPLITWFWTENKSLWWHFVRIKIPLLALPIGFAGRWQLSQRQWQVIAWFYLFLVCAGTCWSLWQYLENRDSMNTGYLKATLIPTPFENDHVRYSLVVTIAIVCAVLMLTRMAGKITRILLVALIVFFILYLHLLSARTGLLSFYLFLLMALAYLFIRAKKSKWSFVLLLALLALPLLSWFVFPTFQNRIRYIIYDFSYIRQEQYLPGANDGNRMLSIKAGWSILSENPLGVGSGDVMHKTREWYAAHIPGMLETDKIYPSSEWMMYGAGAGWPGLLLFMLAMVLPFFEKIRSERFFWISLAAIAAFSLVFDIGLEVQFGVFIHAFFLLWWWKWFENGLSPVARED